MSAMRTRQRDPEATAFAEETVQTMDVAPQSRGAVFLGIFRGFAQGKIVGFKSRDGEVQALKTSLEKAVRSGRGNELRYATNFTPAEISYIATINKYGMSHEDIAKLFRCEVVEIVEMIDNLKAGNVRFGMAHS